ncbi:MAG: peptidoglycan recognition protein family protein, partial [Actinoallomurus sp.]
ENGHTLGIENEGTYTSVLPPAALWNALVQTLAWLCDDYGLDPHSAIVGHRDYNVTQCPGDALYAKLPQLRNDVANTLGFAAAAEPATPYVRTNLPGPHRRGDHGPAVGAHEFRPAPETRGESSL